MALGVRQTFEIFAPGGSLQRRVAYSLVIVRLILVPVIFLAVYYLFAMSRIVDRIISVDAPATTMSEQASVEMLEARRAERNYFLLRDPDYLEANSTSIAKTRSTLIGIQNLAPSEQPDAQKALDELHLYQQRFEAAVSILGAPGRLPSDRIQAVIRTYEKDLDGLLTQARSRKRAQLIDELRRRVDSFDVQILKTVQEQGPESRQATVDLENSSQEILRRTSELESRSWKREREFARVVGRRFRTEIRAEVDGRDPRLPNHRLRRVRHPPGDGGICGLRPQRAGIQQQKVNQQEGGDFVHEADLERRLAICNAPTCERRQLRVFCGATATHGPVYLSAIFIAVGGGAENSTQLAILSFTSAIASVSAPLQLTLFEWVCTYRLKESTASPTSTF